MKNGKHILCKNILLPLSLFALTTAVSAHSVSIDIGCFHQKIVGFGASDCWTTQYVGKYWSDEEKEKAARWLFSTDTDNAGQPQGIGLSIWRFNVGGGTMEQGDSSKLNTDITRRAECFLNADGSYNWDKQSGQQWFLNKAKQYGCREFIAFSNTPPVFYTRNGKGFAPSDGNSNLAPCHYRDFARFLVDVVTHFKSKGIHFDYISPVNEPQWDWSASYQEGCPWQNEEIYRLLCHLDSTLTVRGLNTKLLITEAGSWDNLYRKKQRASNQIEVFFDPNSPLYVGNKKHIPHLIGSHSYWTDESNKKLKEVRDSVRQKADQYGLHVHQTEWSLLSNPPIEGLENFKKASYMDIALFMSKVIYADMVYADAESWSFWTSMDIESWGFKDRYNLIRLEPYGKTIRSIVGGGTVSTVKTLWVLGNYSRFIRPGYTRVGLSGADSLSGVFASAYLSPDKRNLVIVGSNMLNSAEKLDIRINDSTRDIKAKLLNIYITDEGHDLTPEGRICNGNTLNIPPRSVMTAVYRIK